MKKALLVACVLVVAGVVVWVWGLLPDPPLPLDDSSGVSLTQGPLLGVAAEYETYAWLGIPYAAAPVGEYRWRAPRPAPGWDGVREANRFGDFCVQLGNGQTTRLPWRWGEVVGSEDCLFLNVWAPRSAINTGTSGGKEGGKNGTDRRPVMVWIHGGGNTIGHAGAYNPQRLAGEHDLVVVTLNYRLGALGWFSHPALRASSDNALDASGNYGTLDMIRALEWVRDNIAAFGGDPERVTVFGESAGGRNTVSLLVARPAAGLFHRAIVQSGLTESVSRTEAEDPERGYPGNGGAVVQRLWVQSGRAREPEQATRDLEALPAPEVASWLRGLSPGELLAAYSDWSFGMYHLPQLIRDGSVLPAEDFLRALADPARSNRVPLITGSNRDEIRLFLLGDERLIQRRWGLFPTVVDAERLAVQDHYRSGKWTATAVTELAQTLDHSGHEDVWAYRFDWDEGSEGLFMDAGEVFGAAHGFDVPFVFGDFDGSMTLPGVFGEDNRAGREWLSRRMMGYWATFARTGDPEHGGSAEAPVWRRWGDAGGGAGGFLIFDTPADGGLSMSGEVVRIAALKRQLVQDVRFATNAERCETYRAMFERSRYWDAREYQKTLGCAEEAANGE